MYKFKRVISILLSLVIVLSTMFAISATTVSAAVANITYSFTNTKAGYAQGTITVTPTSGNYGTYYLYWADDTKALDGYSEIAALSISSGSGKYTMPAYTAIPADATKVVAVKASSEPNVANVTVAGASAVYSVPASKQLKDGTDKMLYSFASVGDPQLANDSYGESRYPYDETHLIKALETLDDRKVDFAVSSGDTVNDQNGNQTYATEYKRYQKILAESPYANPIYEANGNHEVWADPATIGIPTFIKETGLDSVKDTISAGKPYFEITEPITGDHFIFMALEGTFYTDEGTQFSTAQLDWLEGLLKKYSTDGKNIFIIEHGNIAGWGSGDKLTEPYYYDLGLNKNSADVKRFISLMETYKECVIITAHTHLELSAQYNYSDNNGTSAVMMHNSAIGGVRRLVNGVIDRTPVLGLSEGYIVEVYNDCILFNGINLYYNEIMPSCSYIVPFGTSAINEEKPTDPPTTVHPTTVPPTTVPPTTEPPTTRPPAPTVAPTEPTTEEPTTTEPTTEEPTTLPVIEYLYGDADLSGEINIRDATLVQCAVAKLLPLEDEKAKKQADVTGEGEIDIRDATSIQMYVASFIDKFPVETTEVTGIATYANVPVNTSTASFDETLTLVKADLDSYYTYSSYDQYMALKKAYLGYKDASLTATEQSKAIADLVAKQEALYDIAGSTPIEPGGDITVYFTNTNKWSTVKAYVWGTAGKIASWPGTSMTFVKTNSYGEDIYSISFSYDDYQSIIFTNGSEQTVDIALTGENNIGYYISGSSGGKLTCTAYTYK